MAFYKQYIVFNRHKKILIDKIYLDSNFTFNFKIIQKKFVLQKVKYIFSNRLTVTDVEVNNQR
jgi:hypothetical protein